MNKTAHAKPAILGGERIKQSPCMPAPFDHSVESKVLSFIDALLEQSLA